MDQPHGLNAQREWRENWPVPAVSLVAMAVSAIHLYTVGIFMPTLEVEFGWSRTEVSAGLTILSIISVSLSPFMGALIDRVGSRYIGLPGLALYCAAITTLSFAGPTVWSWWICWVFVGLGSVCIKPTIWTSAIARRFDRSRGLAIALALCGTGLGSAFLPMLATGLLDHFGWRTSYVLLGGGGAALSIPLVWLFFFEERQQRRQKAIASFRTGRARMPGVALKAAIKSAPFIKLAICMLSMVVALTALLVHFVPILTGGGLEIEMAAAIAGIVGLSSIGGRLCAGLALDRFSGRFVGAFAFALPIVGCCILLFIDWGQMLAIVIAALLGFALGAEIDVIAYLATRYFGLRNFGALFGSLVGLQSLGAGLGPVLAGYMFDRYGDYERLILLVIPMMILASLLMASLGPYPDFSKAGPGKAGEPGQRHTSQSERTRDEGWDGNGQVHERV